MKLLQELNSILNEQELVESLTMDSAIPSNIAVSQMLDITKLIRQEVGINTFFDKNDLVDKKTEKTLVQNVFAKSKTVRDLIDYVKNLISKMR